MHNTIMNTNPGNSNYADITKKGKKLLILSDSIAKPIDMVKFNELLKTGDAYKRAFGGATASQLNYYVHAALNEDHPDTVIICVGSNNLTKKNQTPQEITQEIINVVKTCRNGGINDVFVSSITCRPEYQSKINEVNQLLNYYAGIFNYEFIDNACIRREHLRRDMLHLNKEGTRILTSNFLTHVNRLSLLPFHCSWY